MRMGTTSPHASPNIFNKNRLAIVQADVERLVDERMSREARSPTHRQDQGHSFSRSSQGDDGTNLYQRFDFFGDSPQNEGMADSPPTKGNSSRRRSINQGNIDLLQQESADPWDALRCRGVIIPENGSWKQKWDIVMLIVILYSAVVVPFRICYNAEADGAVWVFEVLVSISFIVDMIFSFRTAFEQESAWITSPRKISKKYLMGWFWIDAPSSIPLELLDLIPSADSSSYHSLRLLRVLRLLRLLKIFKINDLITQLEDHYDTNLRLFQLVILLGKVIFVAHILGCFWYGLADAEHAGFFGTSDEPSKGPTWVSNYARQILSNRGDDSEEDEALLSGLDPLQLYLWSIYWSLATLTTVGYGDIVPVTDAERLYALAALMAGALLFASMISQFSALMVTLDRQTMLVETKLDEVREYVASRDLPKALSSRVKRHFKYYYSRRPAFDELQLLSECPPALRADVEKYVLKGTLGQLTLFSQNMDPEFQSQVFPFIKPVSYAAGDVIFSKGEVSRDLLFLLDGEIRIMDTRNENIEDRRLTPTKEIYVQANASAMEDEPELILPFCGAFGESVLAGYRRQNTHIAATWVETLSLKRDDLLLIFEKSPRTARRLVAIVMQELTTKERLLSLSRRLLLGLVKQGTEAWAVLFIQIHWDRWCKKHLAKPLLQEERRAVDTASTQPQPRVPTRAASPPRPGVDDVDAESVTTVLSEDAKATICQVIDQAESRARSRVQSEFELLRRQLGVTSQRATRVWSS